MVRVAENQSLVGLGVVEREEEGAVKGLYLVAEMVVAELECQWTAEMGL